LGGEPLALLPLLASPKRLTTMYRSGHLSSDVALEVAASRLVGDGIKIAPHDA